MKFTDKLKNCILFLDGAMGTQLQSAGLAVGELPEEWNISHPDRVSAVHRAYLEAGSDVIYANTFGANPFKFKERTKDIVSAAIKLAKKQADLFEDRFVALDIGSLGRLLQPLGDLKFEDAVSAFKVIIEAGKGADLIVIETMNDLYEMKAAIVAAKECSGLPVLVSAVFGADMKMTCGASPEAFVALAEGLGVDALGVNCSLAPREMRETVCRILKVSSLPVIVKPNAGIPKEVDGRTVYSLPPEDFALDMRELALCGARVLGGCCGTTPLYISALKRAVKGVEALPVEDKKLTVISSYTHALYFGENPVLIGERINPTGKKRLKTALKEKDIAYVLNEAVSQAEAGAHALDVNVGLPEIDEREMLSRCVFEIQAVTDLPLQIDTSDAAALEDAMRIYNGKPLVNSVNGKKESMDAVFPLVKKYGGAVICLTLDEGGIPSSVEGRVRIAEKIIKEAEKYGICRNELIFDTLAMAVSADSHSANVSLGAMKIIREKLGCNTSLGVSNISFGLPQRDFITASYFTLALGAGLSAAIYNPYSGELEKAYKAFMALTGRDENCADYIGYASGIVAGEIVKADKAESAHTERGLKYCVIKGLKSEAADYAAKLLCDRVPLDIINGEIIPALDEVGKGFENKSVYLPQLLMSAEAAGAAFEVIKRTLGPAENAKKVKLVMATVKGDIHDIGKNIVCTVLRNYGFEVCDLGKDVDPQTVLEKTVETGAHIVGLSALMTTTVKYMKETVALLKESCPNVKVCVGGAVLTAEYAASIGADKYCKDAMETVRYAEEIEKAL